MTSPRESEHSVYDLRAALDIHSQKSAAPFPVRRQSLRDIVLRAHADAPMLERELKEIQQRLGTAGEQPGDVERASAIGHELTNLTCLAVLMEGLNAMN
jgi:hypothetical protein